MPINDCIKRSDALKAILGVSIYDTIEELEGARTIAENTWADGLYDAYIIIEEEVDAADVVPVVRCKDCRHTKTDGIDAIYCQKWDKWEMPPNAYCYLGEKRKAKPTRGDGDGE